MRNLTHMFSRRYPKTFSGVVLSVLWLSNVNSEQTCLILNSDSSIQQYTEAQTSFKESLEGRIVEIDLAVATEEEARLRIRKLNPGVIYCIGTKAYATVLELGGKRNVVFSSAINWKRLDINRRTFGVAAEMNTNMQLTMFKYLFPDTRKIGLVYSRTFNREWLRRAKDSAGEVGIELVTYSVRKSNDVPKGLEKILPDVDALWIISDPVATGGDGTIAYAIGQAVAHRKPVFAFADEFIPAGAALVISPDIPTIGRQAAGLARDVLNGVDIEERVREPAGSKVIVNMKVVERYKLNLNEDALGSVNELVQ